MGFVVQKTISITENELLPRMTHPCTISFQNDSRLLRMQSEEFHSKMEKFNLFLLSFPIEVIKQWEDIYYQFIFDDIVPFVIIKFMW